MLGFLAIMCLINTIKYHSKNTKDSKLVFFVSKYDYL